MAKAEQVGAKGIYYPNFLLEEGDGFKRSNSFIKVPDELIKDKELDSIVLPVYAYIMFNRNQWNTTYFNSGDLLKCYYGEMPKRKPKLVSRISEVLHYLRRNEYIDFRYITVVESRNLFSDDKVIYIKLEKKCFNSKKFTPLYFADFQKLMLLSKPTALDINFKLFLYICSFMDFSKKKDKPCAFFKSLQKTAKDLGVHYNSLTPSLNFLCSEECGLLKKYRTGNRHANIYVLNDFDAEEEIKKALKQIKNAEEGFDED